MRNNCIIIYRIIYLGGVGGLFFRKSSVIRVKGQIINASIIINLLMFSLIESSSSPTIIPGNKKPIPVPITLITDRIDVAIGLLLI
jgi:hypothetical protein